MEHGGTAGQRLADGLERKPPGLSRRLVPRFLEAVRSGRDPYLIGISCVAVLRTSQAGTADLMDMLRNESLASDARKTAIDVIASTLRREGEFLGVEKLFLAIGSGRPRVRSAAPGEPQRARSSKGRLICPPWDSASSLRTGTRSRCSAGGWSLRGASKRTTPCSSITS